MVTQISFLESQYLRMLPYRYYIIWQQKVTWQQLRIRIYRLTMKSIMSLPQVTLLTILSLASVVYLSGENKALFTEEWLCSYFFTRTGGILSLLSETCDPRPSIQILPNISSVLFKYDRLTNRVKSQTAQFSSPNTLAALPYSTSIS